MTPRERWLAALHLETSDCIPFWPKVDAAYLIRNGAEMGLAPGGDFNAWFGSDGHLGVAPPFCERRNATRVEHRVENGTTHFRYETPLGAMTARHFFDEASQSLHPVEFPIKSREDILRMTAYYEDTQVVLNETACAKAAARCREIGNSASTRTAAGESPLMEFVEWIAGVENAHFFMADYPDEVDALFAAMHRVLRDKVELTAEHTTADMVYMTENTSTTLISPEQYRAYCKPMLTEYAGILRAKNRPLILHMCGHIKKILPDIAEVGATGFEAFTTPTVGNTTLLDGRTACPNVCLIGGTNAALWTCDAASIIAEIERGLSELPHLKGVVLTSAGVMPPQCPPETIRRVCEWVHTVAVR